LAVKLHAEWPAWRINRVAAVDARVPRDLRLPRDEAKPLCARFVVGEYPRKGAAHSIRPGRRRPDGGEHCFDRRARRFLEVADLDRLRRAVRSFEHLDKTWQRVVWLEVGGSLTSSGEFVNAVRK